MTNRSTDPATQDLHQGLFITAGVMLVASTVAGMAGLAVGAVAVLSSGRRWSRRVELSPSDLAKLKWTQARAAVGAVPGAWRQAENNSNATVRS